MTTLAADQLALPAPTERPVWRPVETAAGWHAETEWRGRVWTFHAWAPLPTEDALAEAFARIAGKGRAR